MSRKDLSTVFTTAIIILLVPGQSIAMDFVTVGNPGNANDTTGYGYGAVAVEYRIGTYEVTAAQYTEFLNAVAASDAYGLYNTQMLTGARKCGITKSGSSGSYTYTAASDYAQRPVNFVSWYDAARFCNYMTTGGTESGVYNFTSATVFTTDESLKSGAAPAYWIPTENQWYKAAHHKNDGTTANYWLYPTASDDLPSNGLVVTDPDNIANFWQDGFAIGHPYYFNQVGAFATSSSPYGTFDQAGNISEWNETSIDSNRGVRGGDCNNDSTPLPSTHRDDMNPANDYLNIGFRVASNIVASSDLIANAGLDIIADANEPVTLDASDSSSPAGSIVLYTWTALPEEEVLYSGPDSTFVTEALGRVEEVIKLTVTDDLGATAEDTVSIFNKRVEDIQLTPGPQGPQGDPGITPQEIADMLARITQLETENAELKAMVDINRELLLMIPKLRKALRNM